MSAIVKLGLLDRLAAGPLICAEGYLFELERRGYLQAGAYVPEDKMPRPIVGIAHSMGCTQL
jgi:betaine-homocysteine S-methyltransferase